MDIGLPEKLTVYRLLTDWGSVIGGLFALLAGGAAYIAGCLQARATRQAAAIQVEAMTQRDRLQARGIVLAIYPELLEMQTAHERALKFLRNGASPESFGQGFGRVMHIAMPPLMGRNVDSFFLVNPGGASLVQLVSVTEQYNRLLTKLAVHSENPCDYDLLSGHLQAIALALDDALREVAALHDEAMQRPVS